MKHRSFIHLNRLVLLLATWASFTLPCPAAQTPDKQPLPKVLVASNTRTFQSEQGSPFVPFGVNYYRPGTGWAPQLWKKFDAQATRKDLALMKQFGINCARVFLTYGSFCSTNIGELNPDGLHKFDQFLAMAEEQGIYVHPAGPDHWEGPPPWGSSAIDDEKNLAALEQFWSLFAARYRGRNTIFGYDLKNEPEMRWDGKGISERWNDWLRKQYKGSTSEVRRAWGTNGTSMDVVGGFGSFKVPEPKDALRSAELLDFQRFREDCADEWTRRQALAIKAADPKALVTVGLIQWSVPVVLPGLRHYSAFRPERQAKFLDFLEVHFYPLARGAYEYRTPEEELANLSYLEAVVREVARPGKPVILAEFGWYGGAKPKFDRGSHPEATQEQQAKYCEAVVNTSAPFVTGWLNWGFYDQPEATDCSELTGLLTATGQTKAWGETFRRLARAHSGQPPRQPPASELHRPPLDWDALLTSMTAAAEFRQKYLEEFKHR